MMLRYLDLIWTGVAADYFLTRFVNNQKACAALAPHDVKAHAH